MTRSDHHYQLLSGVGALENGDILQVRQTAISRPVIAYSVPEAARAVAIGITKLRLEIRAGRLIARKVGKRTIITAHDLATWAATLPDIRDVAPDTAALKNFRKST
jgi:hypothetical protein